MVLHSGQVYNLNLPLRLFNVYGPAQEPLCIWQCLEYFGHRKLPINPDSSGNGNQKRDFTYVRDVVNALLLSISSKIK